MCAGRSLQRDFGPSELTERDVGGNPPHSPDVREAAALYMSCLSVDDPHALATLELESMKRPVQSYPAKHRERTVSTSSCPDIASAEAYSTWWLEKSAGAPVSTTSTARKCHYLPFRDQKAVGQVLTSPE